jgi:iron complex outermembrane receptor protein
MTKKLLLIAFVLLPFFTHAQLKISGIISNQKNQETIIGASVFMSNKQGTKSNVSGQYELSLPPGKYTARFSMIGYETQRLEVDLIKNIELNVQLVPTKNKLQIVTISGSRFEKKIEEETVSIEVVKPKRMLSTGMNSMDDALNRVPGVNVIENQINIRGGAGWSYGAGSRVQVLVDDMPMLTADAADAKWTFLPIENCTQVEVIKGASSCLYGSSALNGAINFRTAYPTSKPKTSIMVYNGMYGNPKEKSWKWWDKKQPGFQGGYLSHAQKFGNLDVVLGSAWYSEDSYLLGDLDRRLRANANLRYRSKKIKGLSYGLNTNAQINKSQTFFFWDVDTVNNNRYYQPYGGLADSSTTINKNQGQRINADPYLIYRTKNDVKHTIRTRWFRSNNDIPEKNQSSIADLFYGEYQFQKPFKQEKGILHKATLTAGLIANYQNVTGELYGRHFGNNYATYAQFDKKIKKLWLSLGARYEANRVDDFGLEARPVFRLGTNYQASKGTFVRASFGQGYRYPSIAERFIQTSFGPSSVFPNPGLNSETGWSAEIGVKQLWKKGNWFGYFDIAGFWMEYQDMMEFNFGLYLPEDSTINQVNNAFSYIGFRSNNVGRSRINGIDFSTYGQGRIQNVELNYLLAYTYVNPMQVNPDSVVIANLSGDTRTLKYRSNHSVKLDIQGTYKKWTFGVVGIYNSFVKNIDEVFENNSDEKNNFGAIFQLGTGLPHTIRDFRQQYNRGYFVLDVRSSLQLTKNVALGLIVQNLTNAVYTQRPALIAPPTNYTLQLKTNF